MPGLAEICIGMLSLVPLAWARVVYNHNEVFLGQQSASSYLSRSLLWNKWDLELVTPGNLERECMEEVCTYEEAREVFEDITKTNVFWDTYTSSHSSLDTAPGVDVSGLVAGILAILVSAVIATVLGCYCYKNKAGRTAGSGPVRMVLDGQPAPETVPLAGIIAPGLPSYGEALNRSGQHDAPPPPYSGGAPSEPPDPVDNTGIIANTEDTE
ncbi:transmembrane gamma-carboxyglutamic acid protein 2-like isoform X1 [Oncorhynchus keta]|uniref:transmembrane gamma-carboxyglutamic acid protein 2-like isoform X1 n=1 Tax=Oncorhynchus keta TaxID=8018 RepID=UPI0015FE6FEF|nr:transmembrane gamma-carboxyglutamic acid protein 2-like isoform X1 [Oncorhynchus keta]